MLPLLSTPSVLPAALRCLNLKSRRHDDMPAGLYTHPLFSAAMAPTAGFKSGSFFRLSLGHGNTGKAVED